MQWVKASERMPHEKRQIVTKDELGNYGVHTLFGTVWKYQGDKYWERAESTIHEWLDEDESPVEAAAKEVSEAAKGFVSKLCQHIYYHADNCHKAAFQGFIAGANWQKSNEQGQEEAWNEFWRMLVDTPVGEIKIENIRKHYTLIKKQP